MTTPHPETVLRGHDADIQALAFTDQGDFLISGDAKGEIRIWSLSDMRPVCIKKLHPVSSGILNLSLLTTSKGQRLVTQGRDGVTFIWSISDDMRNISEEPTRSFSTQTFSFCRFSTLRIQHTNLQEALSKKHTCNDDSTEPYSTLIALPGNDAQEIDIFCINCGEKLFNLTQEGIGRKLGMCMAVELFYNPSLDAVMAAVGYEDGSLLFWTLVSDTTSNSNAPSIVAQSKPHKEPVMALTIDSSGCAGVCGSAEDRIVLFDLNKEEEGQGIKMKIRRQIELGKEGISDVDVRGDGKIMASAGWDGRVRVYKYSSGKPLAVLKYHTQTVSTVTFSNSWKLASGARCGTIALWNIYNPPVGGDGSL